MLLIVTDLKDAPDGDCLFRYETMYDTMYSPIRNGLGLVRIDSVGGWDTRMSSVYSDSSNVAASLLRDTLDPLKYVWLSFGTEFKDAVARYNEAQPFGCVVLRRDKTAAPVLQFIQHDYLLFEFTTFSVRQLPHHLLTPAKAAAVHALLGEVIQYQKAEASSTRDSRVHRALAEQEKAKP